MKSRYLLIAGLMALAATAAFLLLYSKLPAQVAIHWDIHGAVNGYGAPYVLLLLGPGLMASEVVLFLLLPRLSPKRFEVDSFLPTYWYLMLLVVSASSYIFALLLWSAVAGDVNISRYVLAGASALIGLIGNVLGKVRRNFFIGVRTPWTLASEKVWYSTHRLAGKTMVGTGLSSLAMALLGSPIWTWLAMVLVGVLAPVVYSLIYYKQLERRGELDAVA